MWKFLVFLAIFSAVKGSPNGLKYLSSLPQDILKKLHAEIAEDSVLNTVSEKNIIIYLFLIINKLFWSDFELFLFKTQLIKKYGYPEETYELTTEDEYIITVHRIPHGKSNKNSHKTPVLLMHGLMSSSVDWIINGPEEALGIISYLQ